MKRTDFDHTKIKGLDDDIETSLKEYGLAWIESEQGILFYYGIDGTEDGWHLFDFRFFDKGIDVFEEYDWADFQEMVKTSGRTLEEFKKLHLTQQIEELYRYYGFENIFGSTYWSGLSYEDIFKHTLPEETKTILLTVALTVPKTLTEEKIQEVIDNMHYTFEDLSDNIMDTEILDWEEAKTS